MAQSERIELSVVIPTYMEAANLPLLLQSLQSALRGIAHEVVVVDDDSPDGTWRIAEEWAKTSPEIRVIRRLEERGLSRAVLEGFSAARGRFLAVMDGDLSHEPLVLPRMLEAARLGCELVVASRRVPGGGADRWPWPRRMMSWVANSLSRAVLSVPLQDPMSGYFLLHRQLYERVKDKLVGRGYKILLEICVRGKVREAREVPFVFKDRTQGHSKLTLKVALQYLDMLLDLRFGTSPLSRFRSGLPGSP